MLQDFFEKMSPTRRQCIGLRAAVATARVHRLCVREEVLRYDHDKHGSMNGFTRAFARRFGALLDSNDGTLLTHRGASLVDKRDSLGLPIEAVAFTGHTSVLILRAVGPHRLLTRHAGRKNAEELATRLREAGVSPLSVERF